MTTDTTAPQEQPEPQHSPLPWHTRQPGGPQAINVHTAGELNAVATTWGGSSGHPARANADFIVRAVNAHHALVAALRPFADAGPNPSGCIVVTDEQLTAAVAAITLAEGQVQP